MNRRIGLVANVRARLILTTVGPVVDRVANHTRIRAWVPSQRDPKSGVHHAPPANLHQRKPTPSPIVCFHRFSKIHIASKRSNQQVTCHGGGCGCGFARSRKKCEAGKCCFAPTFHALRLDSEAQEKLRHEVRFSLLPNGLVAVEVLAKMTHCQPSGAYLLR